MPTLDSIFTGAAIPLLGRRRTRIERELFFARFGRGAETSAEPGTFSWLSRLADQVQQELSWARDHGGEGSNRLSVTLELHEQAWAVLETDPRSADALYLEAEDCALRAWEAGELARADWQAVQERTWILGGAALRREGDLARLRETLDPEARSHAPGPLGDLAAAEWAWLATATALDAGDVGAAAPLVAELDQALGRLARPSPRLLAQVALVKARFLEATAGPEAARATLEAAEPDLATAPATLRTRAGLRLALLLARLGDARQARRRWKAALEPHSPGSPAAEALTTAAWIAHFAGQPRAARAHVRRAKQAAAPGSVEHCLALVLDLELDIVEFGWAKPRQREALESQLLASKIRPTPWWGAALRSCRAVALAPAELADLRGVLECARENPAARAVRPHPGAWPAVKVPVQAP